MANIEFKGFKLFNANGFGIDTILGTCNETGVLYLVRTDANNKDGYLVLNGKVYGSAEKLKASMAEFETYVNGVFGSLDATASTSGTTYISGEIVETDGKLTSFTINDDRLKTKFNTIDNAITAITGNTGTIKTAIKDLDATVSAVTTAGATKYIDSTIVEEDGKLTSFTIDETKLDTKIGNIETLIDNITKDEGIIDDKVRDAVEGVNTTIELEIQGVNSKIAEFKETTQNGLTAVNERINNLDATVSGTSTNSPITVKVKQVDGVLTGVEVIDTLGTAAKANVSEGDLSIPTGNTSEKAGLATAKQVEEFVKASVADLAGAMHFVGAVTGGTENYKGTPKSGDVIIVTDTNKEYVYSGTQWVELGDEGLYVTKATTIAGVDLQNDITKAELLKALNVADGAQVNVLEGVKVNGTALTPDSGKTVNITIAESSNNGKITVNGVDVAVHGLGSAAYTNSDAYDPKDTAKNKIAEISGTTSGTSTNSYITVATTQENGKVTGITVNDSALKTTITNLDGAAVKNVNSKTGNTITLTGADVAVGADVDGTGGTMTSGSTVSAVLTDIYSKLNTAKADAYTGITGDVNTVTVTPTTHGHNVAVKLKGLSPEEKASGLIQLVADEKGIYGKLFFDGTEGELSLPK